MAGVLNTLFMLKPIAAASSIAFVASGTGYSEGSYVLVPITGAAVGDTVFVWVLSARDAGAGSVVNATVTGYTQIGASTTDRIAMGQLFYKRLTTAETTVRVDPGFGCYLAAVSYVMRGVAASPVGTSAFSTGGSLYVQPDPPSVTPTVAGSAVLAFGGVSPDNSLVSITAGPTGFSNPALYNPGMNTPYCRVGAAWKAWTSGAVDPSAFTLSYTNNNLGSVAASVVILPG